MISQLRKNPSSQVHCLAGAGLGRGLTQPIRSRRRQTTR